ncbi:MAG TPA: hypothetical protein VFF73_42015 [Planctomycetota bacterium]|nr:hypothetical protein [Planctomycetota bacterium]
MRKSVIGAGFALTAAAIAIVGCSKSGSTTVVGSSGELSGPNLPASPISQNNLGNDGGGFSDNNQTATLPLFACTFNTVNPTSDAAIVGSNTVSQVADGSAMLFFVTGDNGTTAGNGNREHVFVSYFNGSQFTPPVEIDGADRDANQSAGSPTGTHPAATVMIPMNTSSYKDSAGASNSLVSANSGNWLILWDANTFTQAPALNGVGTTTAGVTANSNGIHHTVYATMFIKALAGTPTATTALIGNTATTGTPNGSPVVCSYGFQTLGTEVTPNRGGTGHGGEDVNAGAGATVQTAFVEFNGGVTTVVRPAEDVISFGAATDTFVHCATFGASTFDPTGLLNGGNAIANFTRAGGATQFAVGPNVNPPPGINNGQIQPGNASYTVGDNTSFVQLFWVQLITSHNNGTIENGTGGNSVNIGPSYQLWTANFDLATMTVGGGQSGTASGQAQVPFTAQRMAGVAGLAGTQLQNSTQALPQLVVYNNLLFFNYVDASLQIPISGTSGTVEGTVGNNPLQPASNSGGVINNTTSGGELAASVIMEVVAVLPGVGGQAALSTTVSDVTLLGSAGKHNLVNSTPATIANGGHQIDTGEEFVTFGQCANCNYIIGPDEGQVDVVAFVLGKDTSITSRGGGAAGNVGNTDWELWAVALNAGGATAGQLETFTNNPRIVSAHVADVAQPSNNNAVLSTLLHDDVFDVKIQTSRDGTYDVIAYRQAQGANSENANLDLMCTVYQAYRAAQATAPTLDQRFPTTNPVQVNTAATNTAYTASQQVTGIGGYGDEGGWASPPVAAYDFQGHIGYHCGFQGNSKEMSIIWLYADGTNDKLWVSLLTVTLGTTATANPSITATNAVQIDAGLTVSGPGVNDFTQYIAHNPGVGLFGTATYSFLPGSFGETIPTYFSGLGAELGNNGALIGGSAVGPGGCSSLKGNLPAFAVTNPANGFDSLDSVDAGVNAAGGFGDCLIVFSKIVAATAGNWDRNVVACLYNQSTITDRCVISNVAGGGTSAAAGESQSVTPPNAGAATFPNGGFPLSGGLNHAPPTNGSNGGGTNTYSIPAGFRTCLFALSPGVGNPSLSTPGLVPSVGTYIYMGGAASPSPDAARALFTRHFRARSSTGNGATAVTFEANFFPPSSVNTTDAAWQEPTRIDNQSVDSDVTWDNVLRGGASAVVFFNQDNHAWAAITGDGETYSTISSGFSRPALVDNNISANTNAQGATPAGNLVGLGFCQKISTSCDNLHGTIVIINKDDVNLNPRFYLRVMQ